MLRALGESRVDLLSNNPDKADAARRTRRHRRRTGADGVHLSPANGRYLAAKAMHGSHSLDGVL